MLKWQWLICTIVTMKRTVNKYHMWWFKGENTQRRLKSNLLNVVFEFWIWKGGGVSS